MTPFEEKLKAKIDKLKSINKNAHKIVIDIVMENKAVIVDMNVEEQLFEKGINTFGVSIDDYKPYTPYTVSEKRAFGQPTDRVTLRDTGTFHDSVHLVRSRNKVTFEALDPNGLQKKYGKILGLTEENKTEVRDVYVRDGIYDRIKAV